MKSQKNILKSIEGLSDIELFVIDLFCGAGGLSEGVEEARLDGNRCGKVVCCVNHDKNAILSHDANIPDALHFIEDIRTLELSPISTIVERIRQLYPDAMIMLHASLECTNFSKAKGGQPRDADSRTLAEHLFRYIDVIDPDYIQIENVEEFMSWGDLDESSHDSEGIFKKISSKSVKIHVQESFFRKISSKSNSTRDRSMIPPMSRIFCIYRLKSSISSSGTLISPVKFTNVPICTFSSLFS